MRRRPRFTVRLSFRIISFGVLTLVATGLGTSCPAGGPGAGDGTAPFDRPIAGGNRPPRILITAVITPSGINSAEQGDPVTINFIGEDNEDVAFVRVFASLSGNPTAAQEIPILSNFQLGPGAESGQAVWDTTGVEPGSYFIFAEIDDRTIDPFTGTGNPPVRVSAVEPLLIAPMGIAPENGAPTIEIVLPGTDAGVSNGGFLTVRGQVKDPNSDIDTLTVKVFFDKDLNPSNDSPSDLIEVDMMEIPAGTVAPDTFTPFDFSIEIDLNLIPFRRETDEGGRPLPFFVRVQADDGAGGVVDQFAAGAIRVLAAASDVVDLLNVGSSTAGVTFQGFGGDPDDPRLGDRAGSSFAALGDLDQDGLADFAIGLETASPFGAPNAGEVDVIYGRRRLTDPDAPDFESNQGRFAGVLDLNTVGTFASPNIFNIRGSRLPNTGDGNGDIQGDGLGVVSIMAMPDVTGDARPEIMVGAPFNINPFDTEDIDPCDTCTFPTADSPAIVCFTNPQQLIGNNALTADVPDITTLGRITLMPGGVWVPSDPPMPKDSDNTDPDVQIDLNGRRIQSVSSLEIVLAGRVFDALGGGSAAKFKVTALLEAKGGPIIKEQEITPDQPDPMMMPTGNFDGADDGMGDPQDENNATLVFEDLPNFSLPPVAPDQPLPPSIYDGQFQLFLKVESSGVAEVDFTTVQVRLGVTVVSPEQQQHNIQFTYLDGLPFPISNNELCDNPNITPPANVFALALLNPVCPPMNQAQDPFARRSLGIDLFSDILPAGILADLFGVQAGALDGHLCNEPALQFALTTGTFSGIGRNGNDDINGPEGLSPYRSGTVYMADSDELVLTLNAQGQLADVDGDGNLGCTFTTLKGFGNDFGPCGNDGQRGAKFRGAWYNPTFRGNGLGPDAGPYDPVSLFGYTIDRMPDIDNQFDPQSELLISAPNGGLPVSFALPLDLDLAGAYRPCPPSPPGTPCSTDRKTAIFDFGHKFEQVYSAGLVLTGRAQNVASIRMTLSNVNDPLDTPIVSKELVLWRGTGSDDGSLQYNQFFNTPSTLEMFSQGFGLPVFSSVIAEEFGVTIGFDSLDLLRTTLRSGTGKVTLEILPNCAATNSLLNLSGVEFQMDVLEGATGYVQVIQGQDWSQDSAADLCRQSSINTDGDNDTPRPESWPSTGCNTDNMPPTRDYCFPQGLASLFADEIGDAFGWAHWAGDLDADGVADIACGAPLSDNFPFLVDQIPPAPPTCPPTDHIDFPGQVLSNNGKTYFIFGTASLASTTPCDHLQRFELRGTHDEDQFGRVQGFAGDMNGDGRDDSFFAAEGYDADGIGGVPSTGADAGFVGVLFGNNTLTGERAVNVEKVGTGNFLGCKFVGGSAGVRLGGGDPAKVSKTFYPVDALGNPLPVPIDIELAKPVIERGQYGVSSAGDFNLDGIDDLLISAPGQQWPGASVVFNGNVTPGTTITINGIQLQLNQGTSSISPGQAADNLLNAIESTPTETLNVSAVRLRKKFPDPLPDIPTITFLARRPSDGFSVPSPGGNIQVTHFIRQGAAYLIFGSSTLLENRTFILPDDLNRRTNPANVNSSRVLKGIVFVAAYEKDTGPSDLTPDEGPVEVVSRIGDIDGDGFVDIILGAPEADFINILEPNQRRQSSGDAYVIYGNDFGLNTAGAP